MKEENNNQIFVYGTLMRGERANAYLREAESAGDAVLHDYALYDLGSYPGIIPSPGEAVIGELYRVDDEMLKQMDAYEGEGSLYHRNTVRVTTASGESEETFVYVYAHPVEGKPIRTRWNMKDSDPVWYGAYGSNLCAERFERYVRGGFWEMNGREYKGCRNKTMWFQSLVRSFPGRMYFANSSPSWEGKGVSFFAPEIEGKTIMRLYKISFGQLSDIQEQEGKYDRWYGRFVFLGFVEGVPAYTFTSEKALPTNAPCDKYFNLIFDALVKECGMAGNDAKAYLNDCRRGLPVSR